jgi:hypothetical protein
MTLLISWIFACRFDHRMAYLVAALRIASQLARGSGNRVRKGLLRVGAIIKVEVCIDDFA